MPYNRTSLTRLCFLDFKLSPVLNVVFFLLGDSPGSEFYMPTFRNTVCSIFIGKKKSNPVTGPVVAQRGCRGIALLFKDLSARRG